MAFCSSIAAFGLFIGVAGFFRFLKSGELGLLKEGGLVLIIGLAGVGICEEVQHSKKMDTIHAMVQRK